ncbi:MAG: hypothetical protein AAF215_32390 [Cyanobacteria bacterium P01_A01_bin.123]
MDTLDRIEALLKDLNDRISNLEKQTEIADKEWLLLKDAALVFNRSSSCLYETLNKSDRHWKGKGKYPLLKGVFWRKTGVIEINRVLFDTWLTCEGDIQTCSDAVMKWQKARERALKKSA